MPAGAARHAGDLQRRHREVGVADRALLGVLLRCLARQPRVEQVAQRRSGHRVLAQLVAGLGGSDTLRGGAEAGGQHAARWQQVRRGPLRPGVAALGEEHGGQELTTRRQQRDAAHRHEAAAALAGAEEHAWRASSSVGSATLSSACRGSSARCPIDTTSSSSPSSPIPYSRQSSPSPTLIATGSDASIPCSAPPPAPSVSASGSATCSMRSLCPAAMSSSSCRPHGRSAIRGGCTGSLASSSGVNDSTCFSAAWPGCSRHCAPAPTKAASAALPAAESTARAGAVAAGAAATVESSPNEASQLAARREAVPSGCTRRATTRRSLATPRRERK
eukprot:scaffold14658_cov67-Phaeocystis_antarctica.AAC.16